MVGVYKEGIVYESGDDEVKRSRLCNRQTLLGYIALQL